MNAEADQDQLALSRLVGRWEGTLQHRAAVDQPFQEVPGKSENRWLLGGRFVEMTLRGLSNDGWSAVFYIGYEHTERRCVLVSLEPGERRVTIRRGEWAPDPGGLVLISRHRTVTDDDRQSRVVCDFRTPGELKIELAEELGPGQEFVRFRADYRTAVSVPTVAATPRQPRRFVIA